MTLVWRTWAYFSVIVTLEWASILLTVSIPTPFVKAQVAKVWRPTCIVRLMCSFAMLAMSFSWSLHF